MTRVLAITDRFIKYRHQLRLGDWDIRYSEAWDPEDDDTSADAFIRVFEKVATVRIHPEVSGVNLDSHVVHELAHIVIADYSRAAKNAIAKLGPGAEAVLDILGDMEERICDTIAHALTGVTYIPVDEQQRKHHAPFVDTTTCTG